MDSKRTMDFADSILLWCTYSIFFPKTLFYRAVSASQQNWTKDTEISSTRASILLFAKMELKMWQDEQILPHLFKIIY